MIVLHLVALFVYLFGAYAYGAATWLSVRQVAPVWGSAREYADGVRARIDKASLALFAISTVWFVLHSLIEFREIGMGPSKTLGWLGLGTLIVYLFPPVIMHTVYLETHRDGERTPPPIYGRLVAAMYVVAPAVGLYMVAVVLGVAPVPPGVNAFIGISIGLLFTLSSTFSTVIMTRWKPRTASRDQKQLGRVMILLFAGLTVVFVALVVMREQRLLMDVLIRVVSAAPIYFMVASVYFENRFAFYDLVVKRALMMLLSLLTVGVFLLGMLPWLDRLPGGSARPWLIAVVLMPLVMVLSWLRTHAERWLDRMWLGREFTPVEAVGHVLAAMQTATDEGSLISAAESRLSHMFGARIAVLPGEQGPPDGLAIVSEVAMPNPVSGDPVRIAVLRVPGTRRVLSEDLALLRSLAGVIGFMLENLRLQRRRQEQDQLAQALRLQSSKSELKALRAQINPHFLFNALNAIASLIHTDPARADEAVEQLAEVFRYTLRRSDSEWAPLDQELTFARAYLDVEQARFGPRLTCTIDSDHLPPAPQVPSMLLHTLIENAVKHGVSQAREAGRIEVVVRTTSDQITIDVRNTGPGAGDPNREPREGEGFGLHSIRERLKGHFGDRAAFSLTRDDAAGLTTARIVMPVVRMVA